VIPLACLVMNREVGRKFQTRHVLDRSTLAWLSNNLMMALALLSWEPWPQRNLAFRTGFL
jgi:hypothetical protein